MVKHHDPETQKERQREWSRKWRENNREKQYEERRSCRMELDIETEGVTATALKRADAAYDPMRDGHLPSPEDIVSRLMGDPPVGRRALDFMMGNVQCLKKTTQ
jgi:hypothetical protein